MLTRLTPALKQALIAHGIETFLNTDHVNISDAAVLEPPCSIKWLAIQNGFKLGAFSSGVSGYFSEVSIGRYTSIGEQAQVGRGNHNISWSSTSPFFTARQALFKVGEDFAASGSYHSYAAPHRRARGGAAIEPIMIGNDVWVGHGSFIRPGVTIGDGAVVEAMSVVTKDVPPYGIVAGNPATVQRMRFPPDLVAAFLRLQWWRFAPWQLEHVNFADPLEAVAQLEHVATSQEPYAPELVRMADLIRTVNTAS